jgi:trk system potassium uptake protein TrkH
MKHTGWIAWLLVLALLLLGAGSYVILRSSFATIHGSEMNVDRAVFNVANAATLTGFQLTTTVNDFKTIGQITIFVLIIAGSLVSMLVGGWATVRAMGMPIEDKSITKGSLVCFGLAVVIGAVCILNGTGLGSAIFDATSTFGNCGLWMGTAPGWEQARTQIVLLPLALMGGLGIPFVLDLAGSLLHLRKPHRYTVDVLVASALLYMLGTFIIGLIDWNSGTDWHQAFMLGSTEVLNNRSLGLPLESFGSLSRPSQWVSMVLMSIGANPGGTGAGCMTVIVFMFLRDAIQTMRGKIVSRLFGLICLWMVIYLLATFTTTILLIGAQPQAQSDRLLFLAVSAIGNVGTSHEPLTLTGPSLYILSAAMLFGRLAPLGMLWWAPKSFLPQAALSTPPIPSKT